MAIGIEANKPDFYLCELVHGRGPESFPTRSILDHRFTTKSIIVSILYLIIKMVKKGRTPTLAEEEAALDNFGESGAEASNTEVVGFGSGSGPEADDGVDVEMEVEETVATNEVEDSSVGRNKRKLRGENMKRRLQVESAKKARKNEELVNKSTEDNTQDKDDLHDEETDEEDVVKITPQASTATKANSRKFKIPKIPKPLIAEFENYLGLIVQQAATKGAREVAKEFKQGSSKTTKPRTKKTYVETTPEHPICEICWFAISQIDPNDLLVKCAKDGCKKWYHIKCPPAYHNKTWNRKTKYVCTEADQGCSDVSQQERQQLQEADEVEQRRAAGKENVDDAPHHPRAMSSGDDPFIRDKFNHQKCGCNSFFKRSNPAAVCEFEGCTAKTSYCTNCKNVGRTYRGDINDGPMGFIVTGKAGESIWVCCKRCRDNCRKEMELGTSSEEGSAKNAGDGEVDGEVDVEDEDEELGESEVE
jgi:hypothetical protein